MAKFVTINTKVKLIVRRGAPGPISSDPNPTLDSLTLNPAAGVPASPSQGEGWFDPDELTWTIRQNGTDLQVGQESQANVRDDDTINIADGTPSMFKGSVGASGRITVERMDGTDPLNARRLFGIATEEIVLNEDGKVTNFGKIRNINTTGTAQGETWADGEILWISDTSTGTLTNIEPPRNKIGMPVAVVVHAAVSGTLFVRITPIDEHLLVTPDQRDALDQATTPSASNPFVTVVDQIDTDALLHIFRVIADGGTVKDVEFLNSFFKDAKANNYFNDIVSAYSPSWGYKSGTGSGILKLYSLFGASRDIEQPSAANQPEYIADMVNGKSGVRFNGIDQYFNPTAFSNPQPATQFMAGAKQISWVSQRRFYDGATNINMSALQANPSPNISGYAGSSGGSNEGWQLGTHNVVRYLFNGLDGQVSVDEAIVKTSQNMGVNDGDGLTLGTNGGPGGSYGNYETSSFIMVGSAFNGGYNDKQGAIKDFFSGIYDTPWAGFGSKGSVTYGMLGDSFTADGDIQLRVTTNGCIVLDNTGGVGGDKLADINARTSAYLSGVTQNKTLVDGGINDIVAAVTDPNDGMQAEIQSIVAKILAAGLTPTLFTLPPWKANASWTETRQGYQDTFDTWITNYASINGWDLIDLPPILATGDGLTLDAGFDSGDGLHPNTAGYQAIGDEIISIES